MQEPIQKSWQQLTDSVSVAQNVSAMNLAVYLALGGLLALYIRLLYRCCGSSPSDSDSITRVFPLLTLVTIGVIAVVKSSLALSLGLVGALSIVRFRATIKEPEELVCLFLCIGIGLTLGAGLPLLAIVLVLVATLFILGMHFTHQNRHDQNLLLTITGDAEYFTQKDDRGIFPIISELAGHYTLQRLDFDKGRGQLRIVLERLHGLDTVALIHALRDRLPDCELSYININSTL